jgi:pimeloyl-ACP methyl ester carboxylesterase
VSDVGVTTHTLSPGAPGGPLVALVHGLESAWTSWLPMAVELNPDWRLVALDLPWRPGNEYRWGARSAGEWLGEALDLLDATPDALIAHSFGANATLELLCGYDPRPGRAVTLICPFYRLPHEAVTWRMFDKARGTFIKHMRDGLRARMGARAGVMDSGVLETMMDGAINRVGPSGFLTAFQEYTASANLALGNVGVPTLVVAGSADPTLSREAALTLVGGMPGAVVRINQGYDHFCHVRHARGVAAQVVDFVDAVRTPTRTVGDLR